MTESLPPESLTGRLLTLRQRQEICEDLQAIFHGYGLDVATGITKNGIMIGSQDERVNARWIGEVTAYARS